MPCAVEAQLMCIHETSPRFLMPHCLSLVKFFWLRLTCHIDSKTHYKGSLFLPDPSLDYVV